VEQRSAAVVKLDRDPTPTTLRSFGLALALAAFARSIWGLSRARWGLPPDMQTSASLGSTVVLAVLAFSLPLFYRLPYLLWSAITYPFRWLIAVATISILYFMVLTPVAMAVRAARGRFAFRAAARRRASGSSWSKPAERTAKTDYFRQL